MRETPDRATLRSAADAIRRADALLIGAGAGLGVDSGLPDFRGNEGFWRAYPPWARLGLSFVELANPRWFERDPALAWGFYGHRLQLYRATAPHAGFGILRRWAEAKSGGAFVFTSNVDGHFQKAGFADDAVVECHGSLNHLQCTRGCGGKIWAVPEDFAPEIDAEAMRAREPWPRCGWCGALARPNVLMFGDGGWLGERTGQQEARLSAWFATRAGARVAVIELGAGCAVPTVRCYCEQAAREFAARLIRINPRDPQGPPGTMGIATGALATLRELEALVRGGVL